MSKYRRPLLVIASLTAITTLLSACIVVPARGYRYKYRYYGDATQTQPAPQAVVPNATATASQG